MACTGARSGGSPSAISRWPCKTIGTYSKRSRIDSSFKTNIVIDFSKLTYARTSFNAYSGQRGLLFFVTPSSLILIRYKIMSDLTNIYEALLTRTEYNTYLSNQVQYTKTLDGL